MPSDTQIHNNDLYVEELKKTAELLVEKLEGDHFEEASKMLSEVMDARDQHLYQSIGRLTRGLHNAIVNFNVNDNAQDSTADETQEPTDAGNRLQYVIQLTQDAANKTMDMVDAASPIAKNLGAEASELRQEWSRLKNKEMTSAEFRVLFARMECFLADMETGTEKMASSLQEIFVAQGFQDLTGQVLKRVMNLMEDIQEDLVSLVCLAGQVEEITGLSEDADMEDGVAVREDRNAHGEGPQIDSNKSDVVSGQDDVDDLLSSLGF